MVLKIRLGYMVRQTLPPSISVLGGSNGDTSWAADMV